MNSDFLSGIWFGQKNKDFDFKDFELVKKIKPLAKKHLNQCVNSCNGSGIVKGQMYYNGSIDDYAKREYGYNVKSAYLDNGTEETIFDQETDKICEKIIDIVKSNKDFKVEFQGDPRGNTVKLHYNNSSVDLG